jgi:putative salt-induced outer membrane protein YdiY
MSGKPHLSIAVLLVLFAAAYAAADTVTLKSGDKITGRVISMADGKLAVETDYMGTVTFDAAKVSSIVTDAPVGVKSAGGTRLVGKLAYQEGANAVVETESGQLTIRASDVKAIGTAVEAAAQKPAWHGTFELGITGQDGNKRVFSGNAALNIKREQEGLTLSGYALGRYGTDDGVVNINQQRAGGRTESVINKDWFWYSALDLERDEFKDLSLRTTAAVGIGRTWWKEGDDFWKTGAGVGFAHESYESGGSDIFPIAQFTSDYSKKIREGVLFTDRTTLTPDLANLKGWRAENDAALQMALNKGGDWRLKIGMNNQYDNEPSPDVKRLDTFYYLNLLKAF